MAKSVEIPLRDTDEVCPDLF